MTDWQPIETAPEGRIIVWVAAPDGGMNGPAFGRVARFANGDFLTATAEGFSGDWNITHWMPLPTKPTA